jgi:hypothetical protein
MLAIRRQSEAIPKIAPSSSYRVCEFLRTHPSRLEAIEGFCQAMGRRSDRDSVTPLGFDLRREVDTASAFSADRVGSEPERFAKRVQQGFGCELAIALR